MSVGLGKSKSKNSAQNYSTQEASQNLSPDQVPFLSNLWTLGQRLAGGADPNIAAAQQFGAQYAGQMPDQLYSPVTETFQKTFGANNPYSQVTSQLVNPLVSGLTSMMSTPSSSNSTPLLDKNVALALEQASTNLQRNILPSIGREAQASGQYGGSRQAIAEGLAMSDANKQALQTAMGAYNDQYGRDVTAKAQEDQNRLQAANIMQALISGQAGQVAQGVQTGQGLTNLGMMPYDIYGQMANLSWNPLMNYASIIGSPLVLGRSSGTSSGSASGSGWSMSGGVSKGV